MINPQKCYNDSGTFGLTFKGTAAELAAVPDGIWVPAEGDLWFDTTNDVWKTYSGSAWVESTNVQTAVTAEHATGAIGTAATPATYRRIENGIIITEIKIDLTGLDSSGTANDVIGTQTPGTDAAYIGRNVVATNGQVFKVEMSCLEVPTAGDADILLVQGSAADETFDDTVANTATLCDGTGDWALGETIVNNVPGMVANYYYYLTQGGSDDATYTAGQFLIRIFGHALLT